MHILPDTINTKLTIDISTKMIAKITAIVIINSIIGGIIFTIVKIICHKIINE